MNRSTAGTAASTPTSANTSIQPTAEAVRARRVRTHRRRTMITAGLLVAVVVAYLASLMFGRTFIGINEVASVALGMDTPGAEFTIGTLRLPRATLAVVAGLSFGLAGVTFQTLLRNVLASPDIMGVTAGASAAACVAIVSFGLSGLAVSWLAVTTGLAVAVLMYLLAYRRGSVAGSRFVLIGIAVAAMLTSVVEWQLKSASNVEILQVSRWLTGSLNGAVWRDVLIVIAALAVCGPLLLARGRDLSVSRLGDDAAAGLGVRVEAMRLTAIVAAVALICFATAATGPIAFLAFLCGPVAIRLIGSGGSPLIAAALMGALITLVADFAGQYAFGTRLPVGVVTGAIGAPYLIYLIIRINRSGGTL